MKRIFGNSLAILNLLAVDFDILLVEKSEECLRSCQSYCLHYSYWGTNIRLKDKLIDLFPKTMTIYVDNCVHSHAYCEVMNMPSNMENFVLSAVNSKG